MALDKTQKKILLLNDKLNQLAQSFEVYADNGGGQHMPYTLDEMITQVDYTYSAGQMKAWDAAILIAGQIISTSNISYLDWKDLFNQIIRQAYSEGWDDNDPTGSGIYSPPEII